MNDYEAVQLLASGLSISITNCPPQLSELASMLGKRPVLLKLANDRLYHRVNIENQTLQESIEYVEEILYDASRDRETAEKQGISTNYSQNIKKREKQQAKRKDDALAMLNESKVFSDKGKYNEAITLVDKSINLDPRFAAAYIVKGLYLFKMGRYEEAINNYNEAREMESKISVNYAWASYEKGRALVALGLYEDALRSYDKALKLGLGFGEQSWYGKGQIYFELGRYDKALESFNASIHFCSDNVDAYYQIARIKARQKDSKRCLDNLQKAIDKSYEKEDLKRLARDEIDFKNLKKNKRFTDLVGKRESMKIESVTTYKKDKNYIVSIVGNNFGPNKDTVWFDDIRIIDDNILSWDDSRIDASLGTVDLDMLSLHCSEHRIKVARNSIIGEKKYVHSITYD